VVDCRAACVLALLVAGLARGEEPPPAVELWHEDRLSRELYGVELQSMRWVLNGQPLKSVGAPGSMLRLEVAPGLHVLELQGVYIGRSALFGYVEGYRFRMRSRVTFETRAGWVVRIWSTAYAREGLLLEWKARPAFQVEGKPEKAIVAIESGPVVPEEWSESQASQEPPEEALPVPAIEEPRAQAPTEPGECPLEPVYFHFADTRLRPQARQVLQRVAECLRQQPGLRLRVVGYCDARGPESVNAGLGLGRAQTVVGYLEELGVAPGRLEPDTRGGERVACTQPGEACWARSRRVELVPVRLTLNKGLEELLRGEPEYLMEGLGERGPLLHVPEQLAHGGFSVALDEGGKGMVGGAIGPLRSLAPGPLGGAEQLPLGALCPFASHGLPVRPA
jgi:outer membrane protein OmpA-like peptidoglycan-associated protein